MSLPGYHMTREGHYYYLYIDRAHFSHYAHLQAVSNKLESLEDVPPPKDTYSSTTQDECPPAVSKVTSPLAGQECPPRTQVKDDGKGTSPELPSRDGTPLKTDMAPANTSTPDRQVHAVAATSLVLSDPAVRSDTSALADNVSEPPTKLLFTSTSSDNAHPLVTSPSSDPPHGSHLTAITSGASIQDDSIEIILASDTSPVAGIDPPTLSPPVEGGEAGTFHAEDIRISVIRPSPVKEPPQAVELPPSKGQGALEEPLDDASDQSSGSSIQVLDEKEDDTSLQQSQHPPEISQVRTKHPPVGASKELPLSGGRKKHNSGGSGKVRHVSGESVKERVSSGDVGKDKHPSGGSGKEKHSSGNSEKEKHSSGGSVNEKHSSGTSVKEKHSSGGSLKEKHSSGGSVKEKHSSGGSSSKEKHSSGGSERGKHPSGGSGKDIQALVREKHPSGGSGRDKHSSGGSVNERHPSGGRESHPSGASSGSSIRDRHPSGGSLGKTRQSSGEADRTRDQVTVRDRHPSGGREGHSSGGGVERSPRRLAKQKSVGEAPLAHQLSDEVFMHDEGGTREEVSRGVSEEGVCRTLVDSSSTPHIRARQVSPVPSTADITGQ